MNQIARNVYGFNLLLRTVEGETYYYMYNGHADVTALIRTDGTIAATYYYDAFGNVLESTGDVENSIMYSGYQYDKETGLYYLNARMYDPKIARFLQEDTYTGDPKDPLSLNLYSYCTNNPIIYSDPTGHDGEKAWSNEYWNENLKKVKEEFKKSVQEKMGSSLPWNVLGEEGTGNGDYIDRYPKAYIDGIIKTYETHKIVNGKFVLDNGGQTIGYGHDVLPGENFSGGLSEKDASDLLIKDLNSKYDSIKGYINTLNSGFGYNININNFSENEILFLVDFSFNRGAGLVERPKLKAAGKPYSSLAILITAVSEKNDKKIIDTLMDETKNVNGVYYEGLELRRMDQYEILKFGDYVRDYDVKREYTKSEK